MITWPRQRPGPDPGLREQVAALTRKLDDFMSSTQAQIDAITSAIQAVSTDLGTAATNIQTEIANLQGQIAAGETPDFTALNAAVAALQGVQANVDALETPAAPPATPPATPPAS